MQNHRELWLSVLTRAVLDAVGKTHGTTCKGSAREAQRTALTWLTDGGPDFREVCAMAGVDPEVILKVVRSGQLPALVARHRNKYNGWNVNNAEDI